MMRHTPLVQPKRARPDPRRLLRQLQLVRAVAKTVVIAADYHEESKDAPDLSDAVAGLLVVLDSAIVMLDPTTVML